MSGTEISPALQARQQRWRLLRLLLTLAFFGLAGLMLVLLAKGLDWQEVLGTLRQYQTSTLWLAAAITVLSYLVYSCFDVLGRHYTQHRLPLQQSMLVAFVCYAFNLNLGSWVGGVALRYRLYSRLGLDAGVITRILALSLVTNWLGYLLLAGGLLAGGLFVLGQVQLPGSWRLGEIGLHLLGGLLLALSGAYLGLCLRSKKRTWRLRSHTFTLPSFRLALLQALLGASNWLLMALIIDVLLAGQVDYPRVLGALLISSIAGVLTHIPAGLGVLEAIFVALLQDEIGISNLLAALIAYRIIYFLAPLLLASLVYLVLETRSKQLKQRNAAANADNSTKNA
jgi:uncharacterized membrane protein YbhN (UPF0104 family)